MEKTIRHFHNFSAAERTEHDFYKSLAGNERLQILVELLNHALSSELREFVGLLNSRGVGWPQDFADIEMLEA